MVLNSLFTINILTHSRPVAPEPQGTERHVPSLLQMAGHGGTMWQTRNGPKYTANHEIAHQNDLVIHVEPKISKVSI